MKYPTGVKRNTNRQVSYNNRGMNLEGEINETNEYYLLNDIAIIHKKPTPITINKVDYHSRCDAVIKEAHFITPSTTDYNGIYKGKYIDFEAKETKSLTSFPLANIHPHQIKHLENIKKHKGIGFIVIRFTRLNETYLITIDDFIDYFNNSNKKSLPISYIKEKGYLIKDKFNPRIDYLEIVDKLLKENFYD